VPWISWFLLALTVSTTPQANPVAAPFAGGALFVWNEAGSLRAGIYHPPQPIAKTIALPGERCSIAPAVDFALLLCTMPDSSVIAVRVDGNGDEIPPRKTIPLAAPVSAAWNGYKFLVTSVDRLGQITNQLFDRNVDPVGPTHWMFRFSPNDVSVQVSAAGDRFLYVIEEIWRPNCGVECPSPGADIHVQPIDADGNPLSEVVVTDHGSMPRVATDGAALVLVWTEFRHAGIRARRIAADGTLLGNEEAIAGSEADTPRVVWDGRLFDVSFRGGLARLAPELTMQSRLEDAGPPPAELVVAGDVLVRAYVIGGRIVLDELPLTRRRAAGR
jgi:hypothetical protein